METALLFLLTYAVSFGCGLLARKLRLTAPFLVGGMIGVAVFNVLTGLGRSLGWMSIMIQIISGAFIGIGVRRENLGDIKGYLLPALTMLLGMMVINVLMSLIIRFTGGIDALTAMISCIPGGVTESVIIADEMGAVVPVVAVLQLVRCVFAIILFPPLIERLTRKERAQNAINREKTTISNPIKDIKKREVPMWKRSLLTLSVAAVGGTVGYFLDFIPVSVLIFAMLAVVLANFLGLPVGLSRRIKFFAQTSTGVYVGCRVTLEFARQMGSLIVPIIALMAGYLLFDTLLGLLLHWIFKMPKASSLFSCIPAGVSDTALIAFELVEDCTAIAFLQVVRLVSCIVLFPLMIRFVLSLGF